MRREMTTHVPVEHMRREELAELETVLLLEELANEDPKTKRKDQLFFFLTLPVSIFLSFLMLTLVSEVCVAGSPKLNSIKPGR